MALFGLGTIITVEILVSKCSLNIYLFIMIHKVQVFNLWYQKL